METGIGVVEIVYVFIIATNILKNLYCRKFLCVLLDWPNFLFSLTYSSEE
jgi:hypothetical protein